MMKNIIEKFQICLVLSALLFSSFVAACSGNDDTVTPEITIPANILTDGMTFSKTGGTSTLNIKSNVALEVTSSAPEWCKVTAESSASSSILKYTVMAEANTDTSDREAKVTVKAGGSEVGSFTVKQTGADGLIISNSTSSTCQLREEMFLWWWKPMVTSKPFPMFLDKGSQYPCHGRQDFQVYRLSQSFGSAQRPYFFYFG